MSLSINFSSGSQSVFSRKLIHDVLNISSHIVSSVLIPLLVPTYFCIIVMAYYPSLTGVATAYSKWLIVTGVFSTTVLLPFILVFALYKVGIITSLTLYKRSDRFIPQAASCLLYVFISAVLMYKLGATNAISLALLANTISVLTITVVTRFWKISTHAAGAIGFMTLTTMLYLKHPAAAFGTLCLTIGLLSVATCLARLYLKAHTLSQVIAGSLLGAVVGVSVFYFLA